MKYAEMVDTYNISILKTEGDFQLNPNGGLKLAKDGALQLGDDKRNAMFRLVRAMELHEQLLADQFKEVIEIPKLITALRSRSNQLAHQIAVDEEADPTMLQDLHDEIEAAELRLDITAGTFALVISSLLQKCRTLLGADEKAWRARPPLVGSWSFAGIVFAAANSFKHNDEWRDEWVKNRAYTPQQMKSIQVLKDTLNIVGDERFCSSKALETIMFLSEGDYEIFRRKLIDFAKTATA